MDTDSNVIMKLEGISKTFDEIKALDSISFEVLRNEIHGLVGHNGSGKSTFLKIVAGLIRADSGVVKIDNRRYEKWDIQDAKKHGVVLVSQEFLLFPNLTIAENLYLNNFHFMNNKKLLSKIDINEIESIANNYIKELGLSLNLREKIIELSPGSKALVQILSSLIVKPRILLLDEPTSPLSHTESQKLLSIIKSLRENKDISIVFVSHRINEVLEICNRITIFREGRKVATLDCSKVTNNEVVKLMLGDQSTESTIKNVKGQIKPYTNKKILLELNDIWTNPKSPLEVRLQGISFKLYEKEILGITGLLGAGKTEIAKAIIGESNIIKGNIIFNGKIVKFSNPYDALKHGILYIPEDRKTLGLIPNQSVRFNSTISALKKYSKFFILKKKKEINDIYNLLDSLALLPKNPEFPVNKLSGGNQQKVLVMRALISNIKLLIIDEPTVGMDIKAKQEIRKIISSLPNHGISVLLISGEIDDVISCSDRVLIMKDGKMVKETIPDKELILNNL